jgi:hypothetical protein
MRRRSSDRRCATARSSGAEIEGGPQRHTAGWRQGRRATLAWIEIKKTARGLHRTGHNDFYLAVEVPGSVRAENRWTTAD